MSSRIGIRPEDCKLRAKAVANFREDELSGEERVGRLLAQRAGLTMVLVGRVEQREKVNRVGTGFIAGARRGGSGRGYARSRAAALRQSRRLRAAYHPNLSWMFPRCSAEVDGA
jgi:hypothetical protein